MFNTFKKILLMSGLTLVTAILQAQESAPINAQLRLQDTQSNTISQAILLRADAKIDANAIATEVTMTQTFANRTAHWVEGTCVFPLPDNAAVDSMTMQIGDKKIVGKIREKKQAKALYTAAVNNGQKAALLDMSRDNLFTAKAGNIPPGSEVTVILHYVQSTDYQNGVFSLTVPTTYTPRYIVTNNIDETAERAGQSGDNSLPAQVFTHNSPNRLDIEVAIDGGSAIRRVDSSTHRLQTAINADGKTATASAKNLPMDKDLHLSWTLADSDKPLALAFSQHSDQGDFTSVLFMPPQTKTVPSAEQVTMPRDMTFIIDTSGSMSGAAMRQAKSGALSALQYLRPDDQFNLLAFDDAYQQLFAQSQSATAENIRLASDFIDGLTADGGTEMYAPLAAALSEKADGERLRQIVFLTDGAVSNESNLFQLIEQNLGKSRLFTVGIGSAPNRYFMRQAAVFGRGSHVEINQISEVGEKIRTLFAQLQYPALTDIEIDLPKRLNAEIYPNPIADLYRGHPVVAHIKTTTAPQSNDIVITGKTTENGKVSAWQQALAITLKDDDKQTVGSLAKLWARQKIDDFNHQAILRGDDSAFDDELLDLGLRYQLLTKKTAFVAIEESISRDTLNAPLKKKAVANAMPSGNSMSFPTTATSSTLTALLGGLLVVIAFVLALLGRYQRDFSTTKGGRHAIQ